MGLNCRPFEPDFGPKKVMKTLLHFDPLAAAASAFMVDLVNFNHVVQPKL